MRKNYQYGNTPIIVILSIVVISVILLWFINKYRPLSNDINQEIPKVSTLEAKPEQKTFNPKNFKIVFDKPRGFDINEQFNTISITQNDKKIEVSKIGTNFDNIEDYFSDTTKKGNIKYKSETTIDLNGKKIKRTIHISDQKEELTYWLYHDYGMYFVSTTDPDLYNTTEEVAKSIKFD